METTARYREWLAGINCQLKADKKEKKQVDIATAIGMTPVHLNAILRGRRKAGDITQDKISAAIGTTYDGARDCGRNALGLPPLCISVSGPNVINSGEVGNIFQTAEPTPQQGDIARDLFGLITRRLEGMDMDAQIALRARVKAALDEPVEGKQ